MKKLIITMLVLFLILSTFVAVIVHNLNRLETSVNDYKSKVGEKVVLQHDTLMVIDYSFVESNFTLEDGREISADLFESIHLKNK